MVAPTTPRANGLAAGNSSDGPDPVMPIAIVGLAGRYPGDAANPEKLWNLISEARSAMTEIPKDRFNIDAFWHPHNERSGAINVRGGHYMNHQSIDAFDAPFFSITPNEAKAMDPQQRMALECTYEAMENGKSRVMADPLVVMLIQATSWNPDGRPRRIRHLLLRRKFLKRLY
jgi:hypothetical protein